MLLKNKLLTKKGCIMGKTARGDIVLVNTFRYGTCGYKWE